MEFFLRFPAGGWIFRVNLVVMETIFYFIVFFKLPFLYIFKKLL